MARLIVTVDQVTRREDVELFLELLACIGIDDPTHPVAIDGVNKALSASTGLQFITLPGGDADDPESQD